MEPIILALETSTNACSAALIAGGRHFARCEITPKAHTQLLLPMVESLLNEANLTRQDISAIAAGRGPGSFTGVRIAISAAQGLAFGLGLPVYPISTLEALAYQVDEESIIISALDARMHEVYAGVYQRQHGKLTPIQDEFLCKPQDLLNILSAESDNIIALGSGWDAYYDEIISAHKEVNIQFLPERLPQAVHIGLIAQQQIKQGQKGVEAQDVLPVYIRDNVAVKSVI